MVVSLRPNPFYSDRDWFRYNFLDIEGMEDRDLYDEYFALRSLLWGLPEDDWCRERVRMLGQELAKRRGSKWRPEK